MSSNNNIISLTRAFVKETLKGMEGSHDFYHIQRVHRLALTIAEKENVSDREREIIEVSALLHDISDWKYSGREESGAEVASEFLKSQNYNDDKIEEVIHIINNVSFHSELGGQTSKMTKALACVQDADRLDALGAIGIARCFAYGGSKKRALYDPEESPIQDITKEQYMKGKAGPSVNHFYEKLFKLPDMMKTTTGKALALERKKFMEQFLEHFYDEWDGRI